MSVPTEHWGSIVPALVSGGFGAGTAAIIVAIIQTIGKRSESRATAADLITDAASNLAQRQSDVIERLERRLDRQTEAIIALTTALDDLLPQLVVGDEERARLHKAIRNAKLAL